MSCAAGLPAPSADLAREALDRYAETVPGPVLDMFAGLGVTGATVDRLLAQSVDWEWVAALSRGRGLASADDVAALCTFISNGYLREEVQQWADLGALDAALRLAFKNVPVALVRGLPLPEEKGLAHLLRLVQTVWSTSIQVADFPYWLAAEVVALEPPYLHASRWATWRAMGVHFLGSRLAARAAAAGLSPEEAVAQWRAGALDETALETLAGLRMVTR